MNKTTEALKHSDSCYNALRLAEEALNAMLTHMGMDEDEWTKPTFDQSRKALAAIRTCSKQVSEVSQETEAEALAEQEKQEPVMIVQVDAMGIPEITWDAFEDYDAGRYKLYAATVSAEAIRAEALEEAVKFLAENGMIAPNGFMAAGIRGLK